ncbi:ABC transporter ATP-binding protein [Cumulibacter soli]|uniref:ABC transporter ATP-binding protein n=1 Tax=Cumulibacter soli TaxID=2546344 RepID=UPI00141970EB|nr:AAA family ATPase [Cumulibacter soli]
MSLRGVAVAGLARPVSFDLGAGECLAVVDADTECRTALLHAIAHPAAVPEGTVRAPVAAAVWHRDDLIDTAAVRDSMMRELAQHRSMRTPHAVLEEIGLAHRIDHEPWAMSQGERRQIAIATAFAGDASLVVLDEPERGLDSRAMRWLSRTISSALESGRVVVLATFNDLLADACADFVVDDLDSLGLER